MSLSMHVEKRLDKFRLKIDLELKDEITGLLGYSGSGKTMTLKMIAGIVAPDKGKIILNGRVLFDSEKKIDLKPQERNVGLMFQSYALFNHMTVYENIAVGMKQDKREQKALIEGYLKLLKLEQVKDQKPKTLSGGQKQRAALARILAQQPDILLLDEPFSALDSHLVFTIEEEFKKALNSFKGTIIYISHNRHEIYKYCEYAAVMSEGSIKEYKPVGILFTGCETLAAAQLTGCRNVAGSHRISEEKVEISDWNLVVKTDSKKAGAPYVGIREGDLKLVKRENKLQEIWVKVGEIFHMPDKVKLDLWTEENYRFTYTCSNREFDQIEDMIKQGEAALLIDQERLLFLHE